MSAMEKQTELIKLLREHHMTVSTAESLTGGLISAKLVSVPGASYAFMEGFITYDTGAKHRTLGIPQEILDEKGAIAEETAMYMALGAAQKAGTDVAIASTGNAGPDASEDKPVGLVYTAVSIDGCTQVTEHRLSGSRAEIREETTELAIAECLQYLKDFLEEET